eukprot:3501807-Pyramimonas_sp.AAC.1
MTAPRVGDEGFGGSSTRARSRRAIAVRVAFFDADRAPPQRALKLEAQGRPNEVDERREKPLGRNSVQIMKRRWLSQTIRRSAIAVS